MTFVYTRRESYVMAMNITEFCNKLPAAHFFRCHRSFCVNLNKIREIEPWFNNTYILRLKDLDFQVPVSRSKGLNHGIRCCDTCGSGFKFNHSDCFTHFLHVLSTLLQL